MTKKHTQEAEAQEAEKDKAQVKARVLVSGAFGAANAVVLVDADERSPEVDASPEAVAYAESLAE